MPIYVYNCEDCNAIEEHIQRFDDAPVTVCESCGGKLTRALTSAAFHLKGGGWYKDGYASSNGGGAKEGSSSTSTDKPSSSTNTSSTPSSTPSSTSTASASD